MLDIKQFSSDLIDSSLDILTVDEKFLVFKEIKIIFTRYDFDLLFPAGLVIFLWKTGIETMYSNTCHQLVTNNMISNRKQELDPTWYQFWLVIIFVFNLISKIDF
jgi:hypothetical protein